MEANQGHKRVELVLVIFTRTHPHSRRHPFSFAEFYLTCSLNVLSASTPSHGKPGFQYTENRDIVRLTQNARELTSSLRTPVAPSPGYLPSAAVILHEKNQGSRVYSSGWQN